MKKMLILGVLAIMLVVGPVLAEVRYFGDRAQAEEQAKWQTEEQSEEEGYKGTGELSLGLGLTPYSPLRGSVSFTYRPKLGVVGLEVGNSHYDSESTVKGVAGLVKGVDIGVVAGYWSNLDKKNFWGLHGYLVLGMTFPSGKGPGVATVSSINYKKLGLGLDFYPTGLKKGILQKHPYSFGLDMNLRTDSQKMYKDWRHFTFQLTCKYWFSG